MEDVTLILTALAAGASAGALDALKDDVRDKAKAVYGKLHGLVRQRFRGNASAEIILSEHQADAERTLDGGKVFWGPDLGPVHVVEGVARGRRRPGTRHTTYGTFAAHGAWCRLMHFARELARP